MVSGVGFRAYLGGVGNNAGLPWGQVRRSASSFRVRGFGFRVSGFWFRVSGFGIGVWGSGCRISGLGFRVHVLWFMGRGKGSTIEGLGRRRSARGVEIELSLRFQGSLLLGRRVEPSLYISLSLARRTRSLLQPTLASTKQQVTSTCIDCLARSVVPDSFEKCGFRVANVAWIYSRAVSGCL